MADKVFIFTLSTCSHCKRAKQLLNDCNVEYDYLDVDLCQGDERAKAIDDVKKHNPRCTFPTLIIGDKVIVGFKEDEIKEALGLL